MATCEDCRFYQKGADGMGPQGWCYRYPPRVVALADLEFVGDLRQQSPVVAANAWCGEHQPLKPSPGASIETLAPMLEPFLAVADAMKDQNFASVTIFDYLDAEGRPLEISHIDFWNLAAAWEAVRGA